MHALNSMLGKLVTRRLGDAEWDAEWIPCSPHLYYVVTEPTRVWRGAPKELVHPGEWLMADDGYPSGGPPIA